MLIAYDQVSGQFVWRANLDVIEEYIMSDIMKFPKEFEQTTTNIETLFIAGGKSKYIEYEAS
jgi:hypothetical protein